MEGKKIEVERILDVIDKIHTDAETAARRRRLGIDKLGAHNRTIRARRTRDTLREYVKAEYGAEWKPPPSSKGSQGSSGS